MQFFSHLNICFGCSKEPSHAIFQSFEHMFWVLKRTVSLRRLFRAPKTNVEMFEKLHVFSKFCQQENRLIETALLNIKKIVFWYDF